MVSISELLHYEDGKLINSVNRGTKAKAGNPVTVYVCPRHGYVTFKLSGKTTRFHRAVWEVCKGVIPPDMEVDHIDRDKLNNRIENLRLVNSRQNKLNREIQGGVRKKGNRWQAYTNYYNNFIYIGQFSSEEEARQRQREFCELLEE